MNNVITKGFAHGRQRLCCKGYGLPNIVEAIKIIIKCAKEYIVIKTGIGRCHKDC